MKLTYEHIRDASYTDIYYVRIGAIGVEAGWKKYYIDAPRDYILWFTVRGSNATDD
jgi:hypothetical protein